MWLRLSWKKSSKRDWISSHCLRQSTDMNFSTGRRILETSRKGLCMDFRFLTAGCMMKINRLFIFRQTIHLHFWKSRLARIILKKSLKNICSKIRMRHLSVCSQKWAWLRLWKRKKRKSWQTIWKLWAMNRKRHSWKKQRNSKSIRRSRLLRRI